ncbi:hypothetical protein JCM11251_000420 [Rhodosporidiobolus azoricus]
MPYTLACPTEVPLTPPNPSPTFPPSSSIAFHLRLSTTRDRAGQPAQRIPSVTDLLKAQYNDPESWAANKLVLTAGAVFTGAVVLLANFGDLLVPAF